MRRYEFVLKTFPRGMNFRKVCVREHHEAPFVKRDEVIEALAQLGGNLDADKSDVLEALGITEDEYENARYAAAAHPEPAETEDV